MAKINDELANMEAEEFRKNNGTVIRTVMAAFKRGWFGIKDLTSTLSAYRLSLDDVMDSIDYFEDRKYVEVRDRETKEVMRSADLDISDIEIRLTADGKLLGYQLISDDGIDL